MNTFVSNHIALLTITVFDLIVGMVGLRYFRSVPPENRLRVISFAVVLIGGLVNVSGLFCPADVVEIVAWLGGPALCIGMMDEVEKASSSQKGD
jgi:hypothetical protein